jgi:peptidyl-tRNA hydrolase
MSASKSYILIKESVDLGHAMVAAAHAGAAILSKFGDSVAVQDWLKHSFRKVVCKVNDQEFNDCCNAIDDNFVLTESGLNNQEVAVVFKPRSTWPKIFKTLRLYQ